MDLMALVSWRFSKR
jgi:hypothetical protein